MLSDLPVVREAFPRTVRLVSTGRLRPPVLEALFSAPGAGGVAEIEGATSNRLLAESRGMEGIGRGEVIHGVPYASFVNAAFAYGKPREANRFNAAHGAWYAALDVETCLREVAHHMREFLARSGQFKGVVEYAEMFASMAGEFVDLRQTPDHPCLNPDPGVGYPVGNVIADAARAQGLNGIIYPSARQPGGTCIGALGPHAVP